jgi:hypothetical protein
MHTRRHILINWQAPTQGPASFTSRVIIKRLPFASFEELPPEFRQQYHPDQWGYLPEYSMYILESRGNHPPKDIIFLGEYQNVLPPVNNYERYDSALGAAWKYLEESILLSYRLHNLRQAKFYCPCDSYSE